MGSVIYRPLALFVLASLLTACGGEVDPDAPDGTSSAPASSPSSSSASSRSSSSSSSDDHFSSGDPVNGAMFINSQSNTCFGCHTDNQDGTFGGTRSFNVNQFTYPNSQSYVGRGYSSDGPDDLALFISREMANANVCNAECSADIAAYLWSLRGLEQNVGPLSCASDDPVFYGKRTLRLLTSFEYNNSLNALFTEALPDDFSSSNRANRDNFVAHMPNHVSEPVNETRLNSYGRNAEELADWAVNTRSQQPLPFSCAQVQSTACAQAFIDNFAYPAFRRPLDADEQATYTSMITGSPTGLQWAVRSVLMSPQFLYRSELGVKVSDAQSDPRFQFGGGSGGGNTAGYEAGAGGSTVNGTAFSTKTTGADNEDGTYNIYDEGSISQAFSFSDPALVIVNAKGMDYDDRWPEMTVTVGGNVVAVEMVEHPALREYRYLVSGQTGSQQVQITFSNMDEGREPYATPGNDKNLYVGDVTVAPAIQTGNDLAGDDPLMLADPDAYVLDPFEYASALSYIYTASSPDALLLAAAANGDLADPAQVESHIDRMLDSDLGRAQVGRFAGLWFRTDGVADITREGNSRFTPEVKASMAREIHEIYQHVFYDESVPFEEIYTGNFTMLNSVLSDFYGLPGGGSSATQFRRVDTEGTPRGGVIASGAFMATNSARERTSPIKRAVHFRQDVLCQAIPLPPAFGDDPSQDAIRDQAAAEVVEAQASGMLTTTEAFHMQTGKPGTACAGCHRSVINPLFAIDDFDNVGLARKRNAAGEVVQRGLGPNGQEDVPIDMINNGGYLFAANVTGVVDTGQADAENAAGTGLYFRGAKGLGQAIVDAQLPGIDACLIQKSFRFAAGYPLSSALAESGDAPLNEVEQAHFTCVSEELAATLNQHNNSPRAMMKALGTSDVIRFRR